MVDLQLILELLYGFRFYVFEDLCGVNIKYL